MEIFFIILTLIFVVALFFFTRYYKNIPLYNFGEHKSKSPIKIRRKLKIVVIKRQHYVPIPTVNRIRRVIRNKNPKQLLSLVSLLIFSLILTRWFMWPWWYIALFPSLAWGYHKKWTWRILLRHPLTYLLFMPWIIYFVLIVLMGLNMQMEV